MKTLKVQKTEVKSRILPTEISYLEYYMQLLPERQDFFPFLIQKDKKKKRSS